MSGGWLSLPIAEELLRVYLSLLERDIPRQNKRGVFRRVIGLVKFHEIVALDRLDGLHRSAGGMSVFARSVDDPIGHIARQRAGLLQDHAQTIERLILEPVDLLLLESWIADHIGENTQGRPRIAGQDDNDSARSIPTRARLDLAAKRFDSARDLRRGHSLRALGQEGTGHAHGAGPSIGIDFRAGPHEQLRRQDWQPGPLRHNHAQTVLEPGFLGLHESNLVRRRCRRRLIDPANRGDELNRREEHDAGAENGACFHQDFFSLFFSLFSLLAAFIDSGRYSITTFFLPVIYLFITSLTCAVVTACTMARSVFTRLASP